MKIAIVHDYIKEYGGAERVLEALCKAFPEAEVFTSIYSPGYLGPHKDRFKNLKIHTSFAQIIPFKEKLISPLRLISPLIFKSFDFKDFDVIIVSQTGAYIPNALNKKDAKLFCYSHTPPRYLYGFATARDWKSNPILKVVGEVSNHFLRILDFNASKNVDYFIANSENVKKRIEKFYRKDSFVIFPPIVIPKVKMEEGRKDYYITGGRLARPKHFDLIIKTFSKNGMKLKIFGKGFAGYGEELKGMATDNIEFLGEVSDEEKYKLIRGAKAFIFASEDEDFGITPVEAEALGTPVIAYESGGVLETVEDGKTGIFFQDLSVESLQEAVENLDKVKINKEYLIKHAEKFSENNFDTKIKEFIEKYA